MTVKRSRDACDNTNWIFPRNPHLGFDADKDGRLHEIPPREIGRTAFASSEEIGPFFDTRADVSLDAVVLLLRHHGPDLRVLDSGAPTFHSDTSRVRRRFASSRRFDGTSSRVPARQGWPLFM
jgi:hypothetical protein